MGGRIPAAKEAASIPSGVSEGPVVGWQPIETAPQCGSEFLATDGVLLGVGHHYRRVEPDTKYCNEKWAAFREKVIAPFRTLEMGPDWLERTRAADAAWEAVKGSAPPLEEVPNPKAGQVEEWYFGYAFHAFDGEAETADYEGPIIFTPTHWMPLPAAPDTPANAAPGGDEAAELRSEPK